MSDLIKIPLKKGLFTTIDAADWERVKGWKWCLNSQGYVHAHVSGTKAKRMNLHRLVMGCQPGDGIVVDHKNGDRLDNSRGNLRLCTKTENGRNSKKRGGTKFPYKGVGDAKEGKYRMMFGMSGFATPEDAARQWDVIAQFVYGEFARLNFPGIKATLEIAS